MTPYLSEIRMFGFNFPPRGWMLCQGQLLSISQFTALFSLLGTTYGGNGQTTFALPDLRGRVPLHWGTQEGLFYNLGQMAGTVQETLTLAQIPPHTHLFRAGGGAPTSNPQGALPGAGGATKPYRVGGTPVQIATTSTAGGSQPHSNLQPYLALNFAIAVEGMFPSRN